MESHHCGTVTITCILVGYSGSFVNPAALFPVEGVEERRGGDADGNRGLGDAVRRRTSL